MQKLSKEPVHVLTFLSEVARFFNKNGITTTLKVDKDNDVEDLAAFDNPGVAHPAGIIADMQNECSEILDKLKDHYSATNNLKALARIDRMEKKYHL